MLSAYCQDGKVPRPTGNKYAALVPYQTFHTKTRDLAIAIAGDKLWRKLCPTIGVPELTDDPRFSKALERNKNRDALLPMLQDVFITRPYEEWEPLLVANDIPVGAINDLAQVVEHPQVKARKSMVDVEHPRAGRIPVVRSPVRLSKAPFSVRSPSPILGQHTQEVLKDVLGMQVLRRLREAGHIRDTTMRELWFLVQAGAAPLHFPDVAAMFDPLDGPLAGERHIDRMTDLVMRGISCE